MELTDVALRVVEMAVNKVASLDGSLKDALDDLKSSVRSAHELGVPQAELARRTGRHRNTIAAWCAEEEIAS